ncbi:MAG: CsgG/HfaB family protein [Gemmatimonadaceae bacterium]
MSSIRRAMGGIMAACAVVAPLSSRAEAQLWERLTNQRSKIVVTHPPQVVLKGVNRVSVLEFTGTGRCGPELTERLSAEIGRSSQFELIDRTSIDAILREQGFQASGSVSPDAAVKIGALVGPAALFTGRVIRCHVEQSGPLYRDTQDSQGRVVRTYLRRTNAQLTARISLIDLTTGKVLAGDLIEKADTLLAGSYQGDPEPPSADAVLTKVYERAVAEVSRMIYPWQETISVVLYDDKKCDLNTSAGRIKSGDFTGAAETLQAAITNSCGNPNDKNLLAKAYYNLGVALTYSGKPHDGLRALQQSGGLRNTGITNEAIAAVQQLISLNARRSQLEANAVEIGAASTATQTKPRAPVLTNKEIVELVKAKLSDPIIINQIKNSPCKFDTSPTALISLKQAGASDALILEMTEAAAKKCA